MRMDRSDYDKCDKNVKRVIKGILAFFAPSDGLVSENLFENFQKDTSFWKECRAFYAEQNSMEMVHSETYSQMIDSLIRKHSKRTKAI